MRDDDGKEHVLEHQAYHSKLIYEEYDREKCHDTGNDTCGDGNHNFMRSDVRGDDRLRSSFTVNRYRIDNDDRRVDNTSYTYEKTRHRHHVEAEAAKIHEEKGYQNRDRQRYAYDDRASDIAEEEEYE
jgi:hypothetical protein